MLEHVAGGRLEHSRGLGLAQQAVEGFQTEEAAARLSLIHLPAAHASTASVQLAHSVLSALHALGADDDELSTSPPDELTSDDDTVAAAKVAAAAVRVASGTDGGADFAFVADVLPEGEPPPPPHPLPIGSTAPHATLDAPLHPQPWYSTPPHFDAALLVRPSSRLLEGPLRK